MLNPPSTTTTRRLIEIHFYLVFMELMNSADFGKATILFDAICDYASLDKTKMRIGVNMLRKPMYKPTRKEIYLACRMLGMSYRDITSNFGGDLRTVTKYIKEYIEQDQPDLRPTLISEMHDYLVQFLNIFKNVFMTPYSNLVLFKDVEWVTEEEESLWEGH